MTLQEELQQEYDFRREMQQKEEERKKLEEEEEFKESCLSIAKNGGLVLYKKFNRYTEDGKLYRYKKLAKKYNFTVRETWSDYAGYSTWQPLKIYFSFGKYPVRGYEMVNRRITTPGDTGINDFKNSVWEAWRSSELGNPNNPIYTEIREYILDQLVHEENNSTITLRDRGSRFSDSECIGYAIFNDIEYFPALDSFSYFFLPLNRW